MLKGFKEFLVRGNLVALAVAFVIAVAFAALVTSLVSDLITPLIAAIGGQPDFSELDFTLNDSRFTYGNFLNALITFLTIAAVVFFLVVRPYNALLARMRRGEDEDIPKAQYTVETVPAGEAAALLNARAAEGWRAVSAAEAGGPGGGMVLVLEKAPAE